MSKTTISAAATGLSSRRLFLAAGSAAAVFGALSTAAATHNPDAEIITLSEAVMTADRHYAECAHRCDSVTAQREDRRITEGDEAALENAAAAYYRARASLLSAQPKTTTGLRAVFKWLRQDCYLSQDEFETLVETLLASPALAV